MSQTRKPSEPGTLELVRQAVFVQSGLFDFDQLVFFKGNFEDVFID